MFVIKSGETRDFYGERTRSRNTTNFCPKKENAIVKKLFIKIDKKLLADYCVFRLRSMKILLVIIEFQTFLSRQPCR